MGVLLCVQAALCVEPAMYPIMTWTGFPVDDDFWIKWVSFCAFEQHFVWTLPCTPLWLPQAVLVMMMISELNEFPSAPSSSILWRAHHVTHYDLHRLSCWWWFLNWSWENKVFNGVSIVSLHSCQYYNEKIWIF